MQTVTPVPQVDPIEANAKVEEGALLLDVREWAEWAEARIPGAEFKPMSEVNDWFEDLPTDRTIVLQCRTGNRSHNIANALINQVGMTNVVNLAGGIIAWDEAGLPVDASDVVRP